MFPPLKNVIPFLAQYLVTTAGRVIVAFSSLISIMIIAIPAGLLGWGFENVAEKFAEVRRRREEDKKRRRKLSWKNSFRFSRLWDGLIEEEGLVSEKMVQILDSEENFEEITPKEPCCPTCGQSIPDKGAKIV
jgi:hypothetical protein